jgi:DNA-binding LytR/AlgR family response regulator
VKPISFDRFSKIVEKYYQSWGSATEPREVGTDAVIQLKADRKIFPVSVSTILYVESLDNYVKVHLSDRIIITHENISSFEERLPHDHFIRIHRSYLVNRQHVQSFSSESVFINNAELAFGRAFKHLAYRKLCKAI